MSDEHRWQVNCASCGEIVRGQPWVLLNRWALGTGANRLMSEGLNKRGEYLWEQSDDGEDEYATGPILCWPTCASNYIDARMVETDVLCRTQEPSDDA